MDKNKLAIAILTLAVVALAIYTLGIPRSQDVEETPNERPVGALTSPDIPSAYLSFGGVRSWAYRQDVKSTGSTTCAILSPAATTTLVRVSSEFTRLASSTVVEIGLATTAFATTTSLGLANMPTGGGLIVASSSSHFHRVVTPLTYVNTKIGGGDTAGTLTPRGSCTAVFLEV